jgi:hypothetical protein
MSSMSRMMLGAFALSGALLWFTQHAQGAG